MDSQSPDPQTQPEPPSFEQALARIEMIVRELEDGQVGLAESLARYEEGVRLFRQCHRLLETAQRKIELVTAVDAAGEPVTEPFDDAELSLEEKASHRGQRRSRAPRKSGGKSNETSGPSTMDEPETLF